MKEEEQELQGKLGRGSFHLEWSFVPIDRNRHVGHVYSLDNLPKFPTALICSCGWGQAIAEDVLFTEAEDIFRDHVA